jgi:flagellin-specific chaperone FliS
MNIQEIAQEITKTENIIKNISVSLNRESVNNLTKEFKDLADQMEEKTQYLFELKSLYNDLYKKLTI